MTQYSRIKFDAAEMVREVRREQVISHQLPARGTSACAARDQLKPTPTFQPYRVLPQRQPSLFRRIVDRVNWNRIRNIVCWAIFVGCLIYLVIRAFAPFIASLIWE